MAKNYPCVAIHQPHYLPWLGYLDKIIRSDIFVLLDNVQYEKNGWQNRNKIKTASNWQWVTVPVLFRYPQRINEVRISNARDWKKKHLHAFETNYRRARFFSDYFPILRDLYARQWTSLSEFNHALITFLMEAFRIKKEVLFASQLGVGDGSTTRLVDICKRVEAGQYLSGQNGRGYMDMEAFQREEIQVIFQDFHHPVYPQLFGGFASALSSVDLLMNCGREGLSLIRGGEG